MGASVAFVARAGAGAVLCAFPVALYNGAFRRPTDRNHRCVGAVWSSRPGPAGVNAVCDVQPRSSEKRTDDRGAPCRPQQTSADLSRGPQRSAEVMVMCHGHVVVMVMCHGHVPWSLCEITEMVMCHGHVVLV